jgi:hypothetical protein
LRRERAGTWRTEPPAAQPQQLQSPNVIVLNPADFLGQRRDQPYVPLPPPETNTADGGMRRLRIIGNDEEWSSGDW